MGDCYQFPADLTVRVVLVVEFQCRERLMGDCYLARAPPLRPRPWQFQCRERLMGDCYWNGSAQLAF